MKKLLLILVILCVCISCKGQAENKQEAAVGTFEYLSDQELQSKSKEELRLIRNEIFAHKGYVFKSEDLNTYFKTKSWYTPDANVKVSLSDEEQNYIDKIKGIESSREKTDKCLNYFNDNVKKIYPLKGMDNETWSFASFFHNYNEKNEERMYDIAFKQGLFCDGFYFYNINCNTEVENILFTAWCNDNPIFNILSIKGDKIIKIVKVVWSSMGEDGDSLVDGYHDIDFKLDHDNLEIYKTYYIFDPEGDSPFAKKEVKREITKYKLTDQGIVEL